MDVGDQGLGPNAGSAGTAEQTAVSMPIESPQQAAAPCPTTLLREPRTCKAQITDHHMSHNYHYSLCFSSLVKILPHITRNVLNFNRFLKNLSRVPKCIKTRFNLPIPKKGTCIFRNNKVHFLNG